MHFRVYIDLHQAAHDFHTMQHGTPIDDGRLHGGSKYMPNGTSGHRTDQATSSESSTGSPTSPCLLSREQGPSFRPSPADEKGSVPVNDAVSRSPLLNAFRCQSNRIRSARTKHSDHALPSFCPSLLLLALPNVPPASILLYGWSRIVSSVVLIRTTSRLSDIRKWL